MAPVKSTCSVAECQQAHFNLPAAERYTFLGRVIPNIKVTQDNCWLWQGTLTTDGGYAQITWHSTTLRVHRCLYEVLEGPVHMPSIDHLCRTRQCVNPKHLEPVTTRTNTLRGTSPVALNARKQFCKNGHEFTEENTYVYFNPTKQRERRHCRACSRKNAKRWRDKHVGN